jgi:hypothetical protein
MWENNLSGGFAPLYCEGFGEIAYFMIFENMNIQCRIKKVMPFLVRDLFTFINSPNTIPKFFQDLMKRAQHAQ